MSDPNSKLWDQVHDANDTMHGDGTSDADAVERLAELLAQATATDYSSTGEITEYDGSVTLSTLSRSDTTVVMAASFAPGGQIHPHDHEGFVGAMRVLSGSFFRKALCFRT